MDGAPALFNKVKSSQLKGLMTSQPLKPISYDTAWLNP